MEAARTVFARFTPGAIETEYKIGHDPVTEADRALDAVLRQNLLRDGEGWLSEETRGRSFPPGKEASVGCGSAGRYARVRRRVFRSSAFRSASSKTAGRSQAASAIRPPRKPSSAPSIAASLYNGQPAKPSQRTN